MLSLPEDVFVEGWGRKKSSIIDLMKFGRTVSSVKSYVFCWRRPVVASPKPDFQLVNLKLASQVSLYEGYVDRVFEFRVDGSTSKRF